MSAYERFIRINVHPGSKQRAKIKKADDSYEIWIREPAERGLANTAALSVLSETLAVPSGRLRIVKGGHKPGKIIGIVSANLVK